MPFHFTMIDNEKLFLGSQKLSSYRDSAENYSLIKFA